jgi:uncharacterized protein (DUF427 family)
MDERREQGFKRVRAYLEGELVADTTRPMLVWEKPYYPTYYIPAGDVRAELVPRGDLFDVVAGAHTAVGAARKDGDLVRLDFGAMTQWFEEDEPIFVHPRDPYTRVDILASSRHVRVEVDGVTVANSRSPRILFETGLPPRYYLPLPDVRMDLLRPSETHTSCPYKGTADYWTLDTGRGEHPDVVWTYRTPLPESQKIAGLACFYNEKVALYLDGERL